MKLNEPIKLFSKVSAVDILNLTKNLSVMIKAGITITESLETVIDKNKSAAMKEMLTQIRQDTMNGLSFSKALEKFPKSFDRFYLSIIRIGEESGNLEKNLEYLARKLDKDNSLKQKIRQALFYPTLVISVAFVVGLGVSLFVLPKLVDLFQSLDTKLPWTTKLLLNFAEFMKNYNILVLVSIIVLVLLFELITNLRKVKPHWQALLMSLPILGPFMIDAEATDFCRNMGIMLNSGIPIVTALEIAGQTTENMVYAQYCQSLQQAVKEGKALGDQLYKGNYHFFPNMAIKMISVGEKSGKLSELLTYCGEFFEDETDDLAQNFSTALEPILLIVIAVIVAIIALGIITPIYQITGSIHP